jgi:SAM-dependent methyltransferase
VITAFLASVFRPAVGLDVAPGAIDQARARTDGLGLPASYVVAEAPTLPFRDGAFALVVDRGCIHSILRPEWAAYVREVARVLKPGGAFHLYYARPVRPRGTLGRLRARAAVLIGRRAPALLSRAVIRRLLPPELEMRTLERVESAMADQSRITFTHLVCRRAASGRRSAPDRQR